MLKTRDIFYGLVFICGIIIYCFLTEYFQYLSTNSTGEAYEIIAGDSVVYRINRITGDARVYRYREWYPVQRGQSP